MNKLQQLAAEATDLGRPNATSGAVFASHYSAGGWEVTVHVHNEFAFHHCDNMHDTFGVITETGHDLEVVVDRVLARVQDAVCETPCELIA